MLHWRTFGQTRHSSDNGASSGRLFMSPEKCAHLAGESRTIGYPVARMSMFRHAVRACIIGLPWDCGGVSQYRGFFEFFFAAFVGAAKFIVMKVKMTHGLFSPFV
jgi:hypothetical protein